MLRRSNLLGICVVSGLFVILLFAMKYQPAADISYFSETFNQRVINHIIQLQRTKIIKDMDALGIDAEKFTDMTPETGGVPLRSVIITTWRSGSTFLGDILNEFPGNYYYFEPLMSFGPRQIRGPPDDKKAVENIKKLLNCDYSDMDGYLKFAEKNVFSFLRNRDLLQCWKKYPEFCFVSQFATRFCKLFPLQSMKLTRLRLSLAEQLLDDSSLNIRIVLLVRDPRGTMQSRKHVTWCTLDDCRLASHLCGDLVSDYYAAEILIKKYPSRFRIVRYEDFSLSAYNMSEDILRFYGLPFERNVQEFLNSHTKEYKGNEYATFRDSKSAPFHWITDLQWYEIAEIEESCATAMDLWGYRKINDSTQLKETFDPLLQSPFV